MEEDCKRELRELKASEKLFFSSPTSKVMFFGGDSCSFDRGFVAGWRAGFLYRRNGANWKEGWRLYARTKKAELGK